LDSSALKTSSIQKYYNYFGMNSKKFDRITIDPDLMNGQPCIRIMRLTVRRVVEAVALYPDWQQLQKEYPELEKQDIRQALEFAASNLDTQTIGLEVA
jgi:uncharacterized protein (DUF433 family)